jgi:hypothetical protein
MLRFAYIVAAEITHVDTFMRCLTVMVAVVQTALHAKKMTGGAFRLAKLHSGLQVYYSTFKCSAQVLNVSMASLEARKIQGDPFPNMFDTHFSQMFKMGRKM